MRGWVAVTIALVACGDDPPPDPTKCPTLGGEHCFQLPPLAMSVDSGRATIDLACGGLHPVAVPQPYTLVGRIYDYQLGMYYTFPGAHIELFDSASFDHALVVTDTDQMGNFSVSMDAGTPDFVWGHITAPALIEEFVHATHPEGTLAPDIKQLAVAAARPGFFDDAASLVRVTPAPEAGFALATIQDCRGRPIEHVEVVLSGTAGTRAFVHGVSTVYGPGVNPLPLLVTVQPDTTDNGISGIFNIPPDEDYFVQAWGFRSDEDVARGADGLFLALEIPIHIDRATAYSLPYRANRIPPR